MSNIEAPERLFVQVLTPEGPNTLGVVAYEYDPREVHNNGKPVYVYARVDPSAAPKCSLCEHESLFSDDGTNTMQEACSYRGRET